MCHWLSAHSCISDYAETRDESSEEEDEPTGETKEQPARQGTVDKPGLLHAFWKICKDLIM